MHIPFLCRTLTRAGAAILAVLTPSAAFAGSTTSQMNVNAAIPNACTMGATTMDFGTLASGGSLTLPTTNGTGTLTVNCLSGGDYEVWVSSATQSGNNFYMSKAATNAKINYLIYTDSARTTPFPTAQSSSSLGGTGTGSNQTITVYGKIPSQTTTQAGAYSDTLAFTIQY